MEQNLEAILGTISQKFDMSFDESDNKQPSEFIQNKSANPQTLSTNSKQGTQKHHQPDIKEKHIQNPNQQGQVIEYVDAQSNKQQNSYVLPQKLQNQNANGNKIIGKIASQDKFCSEIGQTIEHFQSQEDQVEYYRSLNLKFQMALNKINNKSLHGSRVVKDGFIQRVEHYQKQKNYDINALRKQKQEIENAKLKFKPLINSKSVQMLNHYKPIQHRYTEVLRQKFTKIQRKKAQKLEQVQQQRLQQQRYLQQYQQKLKQKHGSIRTQEQYFSDQQKWLQQKQKHINDKKLMKQQEIQSSIPFQPEINKKSSNMMKKKKDRVVIYQKQPQIRPKIKDANCTFKPNLHKTLKS